MAARPELIPARPAWYEGRFARWLTTTDHKQVGVLHISTALLSLVLGAIFAFAWRLDTAVPTHAARSRGYGEVFTLHLAAAVFLVLAPLVVGLAMYLVPLQIGARSSALPRLNAFAYWLYLCGAITLFAALSKGNADAYAPFTDSGQSRTVVLWLVALLMLSSASALASVVVVATIRTRRAEGMTWVRMPVFARAVDVYSWLFVAAVTVLEVTIILLLLDRRGPTHVFDDRPGLLRDLLWSFGYPELVLLLLPAAGVAVEVWRVARRAEAPVLFVLGGAATLVISTLGAIVVAAGSGNVPVGWDFIRTVADEALLVGSSLVLLGGLHYWWPKLFGRLLGDGLGSMSCAFLVAGLNVAFFPAYLHTRAPVYAAPHHAGWGTYQTLSTVGLALTAFGLLLFLVNVVQTHALRLGARAGNDPWRGDTLEWYATSPPPPHNFDRLPPVTSSRPLRDLRRQLEERHAF